MARDPSPTMVSRGWNSVDSVPVPPTIRDWFDGYEDFPGEILFDRFALQFFDMKVLTRWITAHQTKDILEDWKAQELIREENYAQVKAAMGDNPERWLRRVNGTMTVMRQLERGTKDEQERQDYMMFSRWAVFVRRLIDESNMPYDVAWRKNAWEKAAFETAYCLLLTAMLDLMINPWGGFFHILLGGSEVLSFIDPASDYMQKGSVVEEASAAEVPPTTRDVGRKRRFPGSDNTIISPPSRASARKNTKVVRFSLDGVLEDGNEKPSIKRSSPRTKPLPKSAPPTRSSPKKIITRIKHSLPAAPNAAVTARLPRPMRTIILDTDSDEDDDNDDSDNKDVTTRCVCGMTKASKYSGDWISCDGEGCGVWQHIGCVKDVLPDNYKSEEYKYLCEVCDPPAHTVIARVKVIVNTVITDDNVERVETSPNAENTDVPMDSHDQNYITGDADEKLAREQVSVADVANDDHPTPYIIPTLMDETSTADIADGNAEPVEEDLNDPVIEESVDQADEIDTTGDDAEDLEDLEKIHQELDNEFDSLESRRTTVDREIAGLKERADEVL